MAARGHQDFHADDIEWRSGSADGVSYARFVLNPDRTDGPTVILTKFNADAVVAPHTHGCNYMEYVIEGEQTVGKVTFRAGDIRVVKEGTGYGPITMGKEGATVLLVFEDGERATWIPKPFKKG